VSYNPEWLSEQAGRIQTHLIEMVNTDQAGADNESAEFYMLALSSLETTLRFLELARLKQVAALVRKGSL